MAPSRRKSANKATAAAACSKWKVGDLVLARVKGFPAWPATVSEPQKWGYPSDLKKVLVYFFGTQQIAFCNPADVEEFTEEKKVSLLGKRHGKGSDFVRALNEIIDCFEKLKKQEQVSSGDITGETNITNENNSDESTKSVNDEAPVITKKQLASRTTNDLNCLTENNGTKRRISTRRLRSSLRIDTNRFVRRCRRIMKSSDDSDVNSPAFVSNDSIEDNDSEIMTVDSDTCSFSNDGSSVDSGCKSVRKEKPFNEGETELSDRLGFQTKANIIKKKRKSTGKRQINNVAIVAKLDEVISEAELLKTECNNEKVAQRYAKEDGDEHLPLVKRARVRMGRPSPSCNGEGTLVHEEGKSLKIPARFAIQSKSITTKGDPGRKPQNWETRKDYVDDEASLPPSKRLHRALEAMSANVAEDSQRASTFTPTLATRTNGCCSSSSMECSELSIEKDTTTKLQSEQANNRSNGDPQSSASEICFGPNLEVPEEDGGTTCGLHRSSPDFCKDSFQHPESNCKRLKLPPLNECLVETDSEHQLSDPGSPKITKQSSHLDCKKPYLLMSSDNCKMEPLDLKENANVSKTNSDSILGEEIACRSLNIDKAIPNSANCGRDETHKMKQLCENNQDRQGESSSYMDDGPVTAARISPLSSSICNLFASDNKICVENNSSCVDGPDIKLRREKAELAGKSSSKVESLSSFEAMIRSLTRTKESIGRATRIAIDCEKFGFATKVMEILARDLESESTPHKKVDLFFLVDSIAQCSGGMTGDAGIYPSAIQALLARLLLAAAPPGPSFFENHRQCLKVLRVWLERKLLPEPIIHHHIRELDALYSARLGGGSLRAFRNERAFDDPIREMEGMLVDEYGSNSSIQLPGFCMPPMLKDDDGIGTDSDGESFEAVTPEHNVGNLDRETSLNNAVEKRSHILKDVDGELEMEDVAPHCEVEITSTSNITETDCTKMPRHQYGNHYRATFSSKNTRLMSAPRSISYGPDSKPYRSSQDPRAEQSHLPRIKSRTSDTVHHRSHNNKFSEAQLPSEMSDSNNKCRPTSQLSTRVSNGFQPLNGAFNKGYHLLPHPAPSTQFSYVQEQRTQSRWNNPPPCHPNRWRNSENGNFYREHERRKFASRDNNGEYWGPPLPSISGPCYHESYRVDHAPISYSGPSREPALHNNRWKYRQFNPYRDSSQ